MNEKKAAIKNCVLYLVPCVPVPKVINSPNTLT